MEQVSYSDSFKKIGLLFVIMTSICFVAFYIIGWKLQVNLFVYGAIGINKGFLFIFPFALFAIILIIVLPVYYFTHIDVSKLIKCAAIIGIIIFPFGMFVLMLIHAGYYANTNRDIPIHKKAIILLSAVFAWISSYAIGGYSGNYLGYNNSIQEKVIVDNDNRSEEYSDLGLIDVYSCGIKDNDKPFQIDNYHLFVKTYQGDKFYFVGQTYRDSKKYPVTRGSWTKSGEHFNGRCDNGGLKVYVNISAWYSDIDDDDEKIIKTDPVPRPNPVPVQEWIPCPVCGNTGRVGLCQHCNGTGQDLNYMRDYRDCPMCGGLKKCTTCGGTGGHYETRYR